MVNTAAILEGSYERYDGSHGLSCAATAKLVRLALKKAFPGEKFSVRSDTYANGASIDISWVDGPTQSAVDEVGRQFCGARFDGMVDLKVYTEHWLMPDGSVAIAHSPGTNGSFTEIVGDPPSGDAVLVSFGADYVFAHRKLSAEFTEKVLRKFEAKLGRELPRDPWKQGDLAVPLKVDRLDGTLYRMVDTETEYLGTVIHQYSWKLTGDEVAGWEEV